MFEILQKVVFSLKTFAHPLRTLRLNKRGQIKKGPKALSFMSDEIFD
jgi:hypothetical protein